MSVYSEQDDGTSISLARGDVFQLRLAENPTTGYRWQLVDWDRSILSVTKDEFHPPGSTSQGGSGEHLWEFAAQTSGQTLLQLAYRRSWESVVPTRGFSLRITVI